MPLDTDDWPDHLQDSQSPAYRIARRCDLNGMLNHLGVAPTAYGPTMDPGPLEALLARLREEGAINALLLVGETSDPPPILACALTGFLRPTVADEWVKAAPREGFIDRTMRLEQDGQKALLRRTEVGRYNSAGSGLDLAFLVFGSPLGNPTAPRTRKLIALAHDMFRVFHAGYHCRRAFHQAHESSEGNASLLGMGFHPVHRGSTLLVHDLESLDSIPFHPFIFLRCRSRPRLRLSPAEQDLLQRALLGMTDAEAAADLCVSEETVRKRWRRVFERAAAQLQLFPDRDLERGARGPEKRQLVLRYVAAHPEELRPYGTE